jgi:hypothetical protein
VVSEPSTIACEDVDTALSRLAGQAEEHRWDLVVGLTDLPLRDSDGRYLLIETDAHQRAAVPSLPALRGLRMHTRSRLAVRELVNGMANDASRTDRRVPLPRRSGRWQLLLGTVLANRPWLLVPGLKSALVVGWLVIDGELWDRPDNDSPQARDRSRLYNTSTLITLTAGVIICYVALYVVNLMWALFVLDHAVMGDYLRVSLGDGDVLVLAWFVASVATVGGALAAAWSRTRRSARPRAEWFHGSTSDRARGGCGGPPRATPARGCGGVEAHLVHAHCPRRCDAEGCPTRHPGLTGGGADG